MQVFTQEPLFYRRAQLSKQAMRNVKLSDKPSEWPSEILDHLYAEYPMLSDRDVKISFQSREEKTGYALGKLVVDGKLSIPIFVERRMLSPLDTFVFKGQPHRMTESRLRDVLFKPGLFSGVIKPDEERALSQDEPIHQQTQSGDSREGRNVFSADMEYNAIVERALINMEKRAEPQLSIIDAILHTISPEDISKIAADMEDAQLATNFAANGGLQLISRVLATQTKTAEDVTRTALENLPVSVVQIQPVDRDKFILKTASDYGYEPVEIALPPGEVGNILDRLGLQAEKNDILAKLAMGETFLHTAREEEHAPKFLGDYGKAAQIEKFGTFVARDRAGNEIVGWVYPNVYDFDKNATNRMLFVSAEPGLAVLQEKIAGLPVSIEAPRPGDEPRNGDIGCFIFDTEDNGLATIPVKVAALVAEGDMVEIQATTMMGKPVSFHLSKNATDIVPLRGQMNVTRDHYLMPEVARFVKLQGERKLVGDAGILTKMAVAEDIGDTIKIRGFQHAYVMQGPAVEKAGFEGDELTANEALFKLACMGLTVEKANEVLDRAENADISVGGLRPLVPLQEKFAHTLNTKVFPKLAQIPFLKTDTMKLSSEMSDPEILDRVLSLNFINPENIEILVENIKELEKASTKLSELLIAARYGAKTDLPEESIIGARKNLDDVISGLSQLESRLGAKTDGADA